ncbi:PAS domain-containing protein [Aliamphritea spongicola]|nr:PAS domain-containing protein [Aliamphritea spongicola]
MIAQDISDIVSAQEQVIESEYKLRTILDNVDAYIYLKDTEGRYLFANKAVRELWRAAMEDIIGSPDERFSMRKPARISARMMPGC